METQRGSMSPTRLFNGSESDASDAATPDRCSSIALDTASAAKTARRLSSSGSYTHRLAHLEACASDGSLQGSQQHCAMFDDSQHTPPGHVLLRGSASDYMEECINYMVRCEALEKSLHSAEVEKRELQARASESAALCEMRLQQSKTDAEVERQRSAAVTEVLRRELGQSRAAVEAAEEECRKLQARLRSALQESKDLQKQLSDSRVASDFKATAQLQAASDALAAAEKRAATEVKAAEVRAVQVKVSADAEVKRCRDEAERLVKELGEAKATINDYMWRCEAMQSSLRNTQHNLTAASEATAATERLAMFDLELAEARAQEAQAVADAEIQRWREEAGRLQEALAESSATVSKFIEHSRFWVLGFGCWVLGIGFWVLGFGFWV